MERFFEENKSLIRNNDRNTEIIRSVSFESLKKIEENGNFNENVFVKRSDYKVKFFNKGPKNIWQNTLPENIRIELEDKLKNEMIELGYIKPN